MPQKLPIGVQDFLTLREEQFVYVDKTKYLYDLINNGRVYFLSRPRRFGKSLMISTLDYIFKGKKELFKDTWIADSDYAWPVHPVIRVDMSKTNRVSPEIFEQTLIELLLAIAAHYRVEINADGGAGMVLNRLIDRLSEQFGKVVVLIDEYDKPILDNITSPSVANNMRDKLQQFYAMLKAQDDKIKFIMLTGVTKFSKVSVFSGLNNLEDITMTNSSATMLGYTQAELELFFDAHIDAMANVQQMSREEILQKIKRWYNGYCFAPNAESVYNAFSTLVLFKHQIFSNYWYETGTPVFLLKLIEEQGLSLINVEERAAKRSNLIGYDINQLDAYSLLYQAGYLTIKQYQVDRQNFWLGYPNLEVESAFTESMLQFITKCNRGEQNSMLAQLVDALEVLDFENFFDVLNEFLVHIPYDLHIKGEKYYQNVFYFIFKLIGYELSVEVHTHTGRIDAVMAFSSHVLLFEFKLDQTAKVALQQIHTKAYYRPYQNQDKQIHLIGANFCSESRSVSEWEKEVLS